MKLPDILSGLRQFCCRGGPSGKQPFTRRGDRLTPRWTDPSTWMTLSDALNVAASDVLTRYEKDGEWIDTPLTGIGFIVAKSEDTTKQVVGGDLDACRDPETGELSTWAKQFLEDTQPFYTEVSPSLCGIRMFYLGHLPNRINKMSGNGDQEIAEETKARIIEKKPKIKEKLDKGEPAWNGLELYEAGRHLSLTGTDPKNYECVDRSGKLMIALLPLMAAKPTTSACKESGWLAEMREASENRLPTLSITQVIDTTGWEQTGDQLRGPHPTLGSTSGVNVVVDPTEGTYCWMHNNINTGGDAWVWLAHECGATPWDVPGEGLLRDPAILARTIEHAVSRGLVKREDVAARMGVEARLSLSDVAIQVGEGDDTKWKFSPTTASVSVMKAMKLAMSRGCNDIYYFDGQIFVPDGERVINNVLVRAGGDLATIQKKKETVAILHDTLLDYPVIFDSDPYLLGVKNGIVDLRTGEFRAYKPEDLMTDQIQVTYDRGATCPNFIAFVKEIAPNEIDQAMLVDWFAIHAIKIMFPYVLFLNGLGRNGKGIYERVLMKFYKEESFSNMPLEELSIKNNRFAGIGLYRKRGQIVSEAGEEKNRSKRTIPTNYLKNVSGDGIIDTDQKNHGRIRFKPFCKATIDSNDMPLIEDNSKGWMERFCKADLPYQYVDDPDPCNPVERKKDPDLFEKLTTENELSGILNLIIQRTIIISKTKTITRRPGSTMFAEYQQQSNSVNTFLEKFCEFREMGDSKNNIFFEEVYEAYATWCDMLVCDKVDIRRFGSSVKKFCGGRKSERVHVMSDDGKDLKKRIYRGLVFDANRYQDLSDHFRTIKGPSKPVTSPLGPLNCSNIENVENGGDEIKVEQLFPKKSDNRLDSDCENDTWPDIGFYGPENGENEINGTDTDFVEVVFKTEYRTDIDGEMKTFTEGEKTTVAAGRAAAWLKKGIVEKIGRR